MGKRKKKLFDKKDMKYISDFVTNNLKLSDEEKDSLLGSLTMLRTVKSINENIDSKRIDSLKSENSYLKKQISNLSDYFFNYKSYQDAYQKLESENSSLRSELNMAKSEKDELRTRYAQLSKKLETLRKELEKENKENVRRAGDNILKGVIGFLNDLSRAFDNENLPTDQSMVANWIEGIKEYESEFEEGMSAYDVSLIKPKQGDDFNSHTMKAIETIDNEVSNKVVKTKHIGVSHGGYVIVKADVVVTKAPQRRSKDVKASNPGENLPSQQGN